MILKEKMLTKEPLLGRWIGIKAVFYNLDNNSVKLEQYVDDNADNNWHKVLSFVDDGHWGGGTPNCGRFRHTGYNMGRSNRYIQMG